VRENIVILRLFRACVLFKGAGAKLMARDFCVGHGLRLGLRLGRRLDTRARLRCRRRWRRSLGL
jgi:hypothetical protein